MGVLSKWYLKTEDQARNWRHLWDSLSERFNPFDTFHFDYEKVKYNTVIINIFLILLSYLKHSANLEIPGQQHQGMFLWRKVACVEGSAVYGNYYDHEFQIVNRSEVIGWTHNAEKQLSAARLRKVVRTIKFQLNLYQKNECDTWRGEKTDMVKLTIVNLYLVFSLYWILYKYCHPIITKYPIFKMKNLQFGELK